MISFRRRIDDIVQQLVDRGGGHMHPGIGRSIINIYPAVVIGYPAIAEDDIGDISYPFLSFRRDEITAGFVDDLV